MQTVGDHYQQIRDESMRIDSERMQLVDKLFPDTRALITEHYHPIPWLTIAGGLRLWRFIVEYHRSGDYIALQIRFTTPQTEVYGASGRHSEELSLTRVYSAKDLATIDNPSVPIMNMIRQVAEHEILEGLCVNNGASLSTFYNEEVNALHGGEKVKTEARLPSSPESVKNWNRVQNSASSLPVPYMPPVAKAPVKKSMFNCFIDTIGFNPCAEIPESVRQPDLEKMFAESRKRLIADFIQEADRFAKIPVPVNNFDRFRDLFGFDFGIAEDRSRDENRASYYKYYREKFSKRTSAR